MRGAMERVSCQGRFVRLLGLLVLAIGVLLPAGGTRAGGPHELRAAKVEPGSVSLDGALDEAVWGRAEPLAAFVQRSPREGAAPSQRTELRVLHDGGALYFGIRLLDSDPERIRRAMGPTDAIPRSDTVTVYVDPVRSGRRGYYFKVNASGVRADGLIYGENVLDGSWNGVWEAETRVHERGWTAEMRLPLTSIAYQDRKEQSWGLYVERELSRLAETSGWPAMPKSTPTFVSRFGRLTGLSDLRRSTSLRLIPYVSAEVTAQRPADSTRPERRVRPGAGLDLRYAFSGGTSVAATFNPDFGQVEEDPAVVNLTPTEVFRAERRPFFLEGASLFQTPLTLLYTRRIGARPSAPDEAFGGEITEVDPESTIAGALRLHGDQGRVTYGGLAAVVLPAHAEETLPGGAARERVARVGAVHGAARTVVRVVDRVSLGAMAVTYTPYGSDDLGERPDGTYVGALDWDLRSEGGWLLRGQLAGATADAGAGYSLFAVAGQQGAPTWRYWVEAESVSEDYDVAEVGYQWRGDMVRLRPYLQYRLDAPWSILREVYVTLWGIYGMSHDDPSVSFERQLELATWFMFTNRWELWTGFGGRAPVQDDRETRGGPVYPRPEQWYVWLGGLSDPTLPVHAYGTTSLRGEGGGLALHTDLTVQADVLGRLTVSLMGRYLRERRLTRWVETVEQAGRDRYLFATLDRDELELKASALLGITRALTFTLFGQLLYSVGTHGAAQELLPLAGGEHVLGGTDLLPDPDFATLTLQVNAVLRYDLGGGAAAHLVYKLTGELERDGTPVTFDLGGDLSTFGGRDHLHLVLLKVSYGWDL